jgi:hypothetical protein
VTLSDLSDGFIIVAKCSNETFIMFTLAICMRMMLTTLAVDELLNINVDLSQLHA